MTSWRIFRVMRDHEGARSLAKTDPPPLSKKVSKQVKAPKDGHGKRRGSESN